jgi:predicted transcriptional regulator
MTGEVRSPSAVTIRVNGALAGRRELPDGPADHRGILSWHSQLKDRKLREAGSYGYLLEVEVPRAALEKAAASGTLEIRLEVDSALPGGLAIYGARFGRYPVDPTVLFVRNQ